MTKSLNRTEAPPIQQAKLPEISLGDDSNVESRLISIPVNEPVSRIDLVFNTGSLHQNKKLSLTAVKSLLFSGTDSKTEEQIINELDSLGAYYGTDSESNTLTVSLYSTPELVKEAFTLFLNAILNASFPDDKIALFKTKQKAQLSQNLKKPSYLCNKRLKELFFETPIFKNSLSTNAIESLDKETIRNFHKHIINSGCLAYICSSNLDVDWLKTEISDNVPQGTKAIIHKPDYTEKYPLHQHVHYPSAVQTALKGKVTCIGKKHKDYPLVLLANILYGGYFGSLLMQNIREEKGLTYGIHTSLKSKADYSTLNIGSDIKSHTIDVVLTEIKKEHHNLITGNFSLEVFEKTKSFTLGLIAQSCDDLFSNLEKTQLIHNQNIGNEYYTHLFNSIATATKDDLVKAAKNHIHIQNALFVTCGPEQ